MAKKRRQRIERKDEEIPFKFPEFDESKFIEDEMRGAKTTFVAALLGIIWAVIAAIVMYAAGGTSPFWYLFGGGLAFGVTMRFVFPLFKVAVAEVDWKGWLGSYGVYFFTWMAVWILIINPPFMDLQNPSAAYTEVWFKPVDINGTEVVPLDGDGMELEIPSLEDGRRYRNSDDWNAAIGGQRGWEASENARWYKVETEDRDSFPIPAPALITIRSRITDNTAIDEDSVRITVKTGEGTTVAGGDMRKIDDHVYAFDLLVDWGDKDTWSASKYTYNINFADVKDNSYGKGAGFTLRSPSEWEERITLDEAEKAKIPGVKVDEVALEYQPVNGTTGNATGPWQSVSLTPAALENETWDFAYVFRPSNIRITFAFDRPGNLDQDGLVFSMGKDGEAMELDVAPRFKDGNATVVLEFHDEPSAPSDYQFTLNYRDEEGKAGKVKGSFT